MPISLPKSPTVTHIAIAIDSSGSMSSLSKMVIENFNAIVDSLRDSANKLGQEVFVSLYSFGQTVTTLYKNKPVNSVPKLGRDNYIADGGTPMFEACWRAVTDLQGTDGPEVANLLTVLTDGDENSSHHTAKTAFLGSIKGLLATDRWTITFSVPVGGRRTLESFGIPSGNIQEWDTNEKGLEIATQSLSNSYGTYLSTRASGQMSTKGFFTAAVTPQQAAAAKKKLDDVRRDFREMTVRTQDPKTIQEFVEARGLDFAKGRAFYQLSKAEKVQAAKEVLLREIKTGAVYGGAQARDILGLPKGVDVKVKPDEMGTWDVFVQSTSNNRKLQVGTNLLYLKR